MTGTTIRPGAEDRAPEEPRPGQAEHVWIPAPGGPLSGWLHHPGGGTTRAGVLVCAPLGKEHISSYRALRRLAEDLAEAGLATLRFDYLGTGDSAEGPGDEGAVGAWQEGVHAAADWLISSGAQRLALVGMRMGAVFAGLEASRRSDVDALVLWDPCLSGRQFLREQRALRLVSLPGHAPRQEAGVEAPGFVYGPATVADLGRLDVRAVRDSFPDRTLLLSRSTDDETAFAGGLSSGLEMSMAPDQSRLLDHSSVLAVEPTDTMARIEAWLSAALTGRPEPLRPVPTDPVAVVSGHGVARVEEEALALGPAGLFAMRTAAPAVLDPNLPCVVFLNVAEEPHVGPGRLWVDLARTLSRHGFEVVRLDFNGVGDSPARPGRLTFPTATTSILTDKALIPTDETEAERLFPNPSYDQGNLDDVAEAARAIGRPLILVGLCSGAYHAIEMGAALGVAGVCAINPILDFTPPEVRAGLPMDPRRLAAQPRKPWANAVKNRRLGSLVRSLMPDSVWHLIHLLRLQPSPVGGLRLLADRDIVSLVVCSAHDAEPFLERGARTLRRLMANERFTFTVIPELDHALFVWAQRERVALLLKDHLINAFATEKATDGQVWTGAAPRPGSPGVPTRSTASERP